MYEYKVIRISVSMWTGKPKEDYVDVITEYAARGWRFVQVYQYRNASRGTGYVEVIFEKSTDQ